MNFAMNTGMGVWNGGKPPARIVSTGSITAGNALMDTTTANAFAAPAGVDLTAFQTGKYKYRLFNDSGILQAEAWISATAPGGETLDVDLLNGWNLTSGWTVIVGMIIDSANAMHSSTGGVGVYVTANPISIGQLFKCDYSFASTATAQLRIINSTIDALQPTSGTIASGSYIMSAILGKPYIRHNAGGATTIDSLVFNKVLTPSVTGIWFTPISDTGVNLNAASLTITVTKD